MVPLTIKALRVPPYPFGPFLETLRSLFNSLELRELAASRRQFQRERLGSSPPLSLSLSPEGLTRVPVCVYLSPTAVPAAPQGYDHPEGGPRLAAEEEVPAGTGRRHRHPVRVQARASQAAAEAAEDRGAVGSAPEEAQHGHGEQDCSAAEEDGRSGLGRARAHTHAHTANYLCSS